jgi:hypothetical protein
MSQGQRSAWQDRIPCAYIGDYPGLDKGSRSFYSAPLTGRRGSQEKGPDLLPRIGACTGEVLSRQVRARRDPKSLFRRLSLGKRACGWLRQGSAALVFVFAVVFGVVVGYWNEPFHSMVKISSYAGTTNSASVIPIIQDAKHPEPCLPSIKTSELIISDFGDTFGFNLPLHSWLNADRRLVYRA